MIGSDIHRYIDGGNAGFLAGCVLSEFSLNSNICYTNDVSIRVDANAILLSWHPKTARLLELRKRIFNSNMGPLRLYVKAPPNRRGRWPTNTIVGFSQPEHPLEASIYFEEDPDVKIQTLFTVYFTVSKEFDAVLVDIEEVISQIPKVNSTWKEFPMHGTVSLRLSRTDRESIVDVKKILEAIFAGRIATTQQRGRATQYEIWHAFFATDSGIEWLQHLAREMGVTIISDELQQRIRIYDLEDEDAHIRNVERRITEKVASLNISEETHTIQFDAGGFRNLLVSDKISKAQKKLGESNVDVDVRNQALVLHCQRQTALLVTFELDLPLPPPSVLKKSDMTCPQCGDITSNIKFSTCGHVVCKECFNHQLQVASSDLTGNHFPLVCWHENCEQPIAIADLRKHATGSMIDALLKASLTYHIRAFPDRFRYCRTPDCQTVYFITEDPEMFTCPTCLTQTCTSCHVEPHVDRTCAQYKRYLQSEKPREELLNAYKATAGTKECPKCATLIEKVDGCNHVECSGCHGHIYWVCFKIFSRSYSEYQHMNDVHGGNGLVEEDSEDSGDSGDDEDDESGSPEWSGSDGESELDSKRGIRS